MTVADWMRMMLVAFVAGCTAGGVRPGEVPALLGEKLLESDQQIFGTWEKQWD